MVSASRKKPPTNNTYSPNKYFSGLFFRKSSCPFGLGGLVRATNTITGNITNSNKIANTAQIHHISNKTGKATCKAIIVVITNKKAIENVFRERLMTSAPSPFPRVSSGNCSGRLTQPLVFWQNRNTSSTRHRMHQLSDCHSGLNSAQLYQNCFG